jgi:predicted DCC family thiol-disulfide oxidoreductase YuxK
MSERYLLFDGGCSVCAALAREVETLSGGRLRVRSLRDPEVQALLDRARPGWQWEPMLVEIEGERVRVLAGLSLQARLVQVFGPAQALRVTQLTLAGAPSSSPVRA